MHVIRTLQNLRIDLLTQRTFLGGGVTSIDGYQMVLSTSNSGYEQLELIFFDYYSIGENDVIVDVGCGRGRVFSYLLYKGLENQMIGYEINEAVGDKTKHNLARYKNVEIRSENILNNFPEDGNVFYLFNPFREQMATEFKNNIWKIRDRNPVILYYNPEYLDVFKDTRFTFEIKDIPMLQSGYEVKLAIIRIAYRKS
jgi:SAM-dependent methyltransferase